MELFTLVVIAALLIWLRNSLSSDVHSLFIEVRKLRDEIKELRQNPQGDVQGVSASATEETVKVYTQSKPVVHEYKPTEQTTEEATTANEKVEPVPPLTTATEVFAYHEEAEHVPQPTTPVFTPPPSRPGFFERHPDLEKFIGENLVNKIGIGILVLGIAFFVKYAIDQNWINEVGRVCIGILSGGILIGIAHRLRVGFKAFSSVLVGGGLAVLYFTIAISFHEYHLFSQSAAFAIMVVITAFAVVLAFAYDRVELAVLALIGGFVTPFMVSTGEGNYKVLFTYLLILNAGMLALAFRKKWNLVNVLCFVFTVLIYGTWLVTKCIDVDGGPFMGALLFVTAFYVVFFLSNVIYNIRHKTVFKALEIGLLVSNTAMYYAAGMGVLHEINNGIYQGLFTVALGVFNFCFAFALYKNRSIDRNLVFLLIGLVLTFISLAAPVQLQGNYITLFWAAEAVLLLWFSQKSGLKLVKVTSVLVSFLMLISLMMDWSNLYFGFQTFPLPVLLNKAFITGVVSVISVFAIRKLLSHENEDHHLLPLFTVKMYRFVLSVVFVMLLYFVFYFELNYQLQQSNLGYNAHGIGIGLYNAAFILTAYILYRSRLERLSAIVFFSATFLFFIAYVFKYNPCVAGVREEYLVNGVNSIFFFMHFALAALFCACIFVFYQMAQRVFNETKYLDAVKWAMVFLVVYIGSAELNHIVSWLSYTPERMLYAINRQVSKAGYTVLWGVISFVLIRQGMKHKDRMLRIISLTLFFVAILKLFLYDIRGISEGGKIMAFISLGVLLLVVSFMYQRLKKLILDDDSKNQIEKNNNLTSQDNL